MEIKNSIYLQCLLCIASCLPACGQVYYGNNTDSIEHNIIELRDISVSGLKINDSPDRAVELLGLPSKKRSDVDEYNDETFTVFYYGQDENTFFYFYQLDPDKFLLSDFLLFDLSFSLDIGQNNFKVGESLEKLQVIYPGSYTAYQENTSPHKSFRLVVFEDGKRKGLEIIFVIRNDKIYNISTRYDE